MYSINGIYLFIFLNNLINNLHLYLNILYYIYKNNEHIIYNINMFVCQYKIK